MFHIKTPGEIQRLKDKLFGISQELAVLAEKLKQERQKERELCKKLSELASDEEDFEKLYEDIDYIRKDENEVLSKGEDDISDPRLRDSAIDSITRINEHLKKDEIFFEKDDEKVEGIEQQQLSIEKELEETSKNIIKIEEQIHDLEKKNEELTEKLEVDLEN
jgi:chromosome segregation ATPase